MYSLQVADRRRRRLWMQWSWATKLNCTVPANPTHPPFSNCFHSWCQRSQWQMHAMLDITWEDQRSASQRWSTHCKSVPHCLWVGNEIPGRENQAGGPALSQNGNARLRSQPYHPKGTSKLCYNDKSCLTQQSSTAPFQQIPPTLHLAIVFTVGAKGRSDRCMQC